MVILIETKRDIGTVPSGTRIRAEVGELNAAGLKPGVDYRPLGTCIRGEQSEWPAAAPQTAGSVGKT